MRLQFTLDKITLNPICHLQISRHAEEYVNKYAAGQLYGELYDDVAHITNILTFPQPEQMSTKQQLDGMEVRHKEMLNNFNLDTTNLGWFMVSYHDNYWDSIEAVKYYEKYINTSFFLVYDYQARIRGQNPYKGFRLTDQFMQKQDFKFSQLLKQPNTNNSPFMSIPVEIEKNQIFQLVMLFNRKQMLKTMRKKHEAKTQQKNVINEKIEKYMETLEESTQSNRAIAQKINKEKDHAQFSQYCHYFSQNLKASHQEQSLKNFQINLNELNNKMKNL